MTDDTIIDFSKLRPSGPPLKDVVEVEYPYTVPPSGEQVGRPPTKLLTTEEIQKMLADLADGVVT
jgi:hypothetical protein